MRTVPAHAIGIRAILKPEEMKRQKTHESYVLWLTTSYWDGGGVDQFASFGG